jgi:mannose-1-phosphate guanylyltransferase
VKAFLLAAGLGTRLRPLTDTVPKCLVPVQGRPLLDLWLDALDRAGVAEVLVNTHHLACRVREHVLARVGPPVVRLVHEEELRGSAGTLRANRDFVAGEDMFLALNADNLTDFDLGVLVAAHRAGGRLATIALFRAPRPSACGIAEVDAAGTIVGFVEKPEHPAGDLANAGMYAFSGEVFDLLDGPEPLDIGRHLLPRLVGRAGSVTVGDAYFLDVGTPEALERARTQWTGAAR